MAQLGMKQHPSHFPYIPTLGLYEDFSAIWAKAPAPEAASKMWRAESFPNIDISSEIVKMNLLQA